MPSGAAMLAAWLAEDRGRRCGSISYASSTLWVCWVYDEDSEPHGYSGPTPDAAMKAAVKVARKGAL